MQLLKKFPINQCLLLMKFKWYILSNIFCVSNRLKMLKAYDFRLPVVKHLLNWWRSTTMCGMHHVNTNTRGDQWLTWRAAELEAWVWGSISSSLLVLTSLIAEGRRGTEPVRLFLSLFSSTIYYFSPFCLLLMTNLSAASVVAACECSAKWAMHRVFFFVFFSSLWKHLCLPSEAQSLNGDKLKPNRGICL